jgi:hypothetical protein
MSDPIGSHDAQHELAHRISGRLEVTLYWNADDNSTSLEIFDAATEATLHVAVARERALGALNHPFAHPGAMSNEAAFVRELRA